MQIALCKKSRKGESMMRYLTLRIEDNSERILRVLKFIAMLVIVIAAVVLGCGEVNIANLENLYPTTEENLMQQRISVEEQARQYIQSLELPEEVYEDVAVLAEEIIPYYNPTDEERQMAYLVAKSEAGIEDSFGQTLVINVAINNMKASGRSNLIEEFNASGRYSSVKNGVPSIYIKAEDKWIPVTEDMLSDELKAAVDRAFEKDYTEELLKEVAEEKGLDETYYEDGALYFYNPNAVSDYQASLRANIKVFFQYGRHVFYRVWDK